MPRNKLWMLTVLSLFLLAATVACQNLATSEAGTTSERPLLAELESIEQLQTAFNDSDGNPRLLMILAPL